jgi:hypothetical protein
MSAGNAAVEAAYAGIDVACAKAKRLPICVVNSHLQPLPLRDFNQRPPQGEGNAAILRHGVVERFVRHSADYLRAVERHFCVSIKRIAIDAPSAPKGVGVSRRVCEVHLDQLGISCITTPDAKQFEALKRRGADHLAAGGSEATMPGANQLWMLVGFALFKRLRLEWECLEVYPQAIVAGLGAANDHKTTAQGLKTQANAIARRTGWPLSIDALRTACFGSSHDRLDAYMSAWVASLEGKLREPLGSPPDDVIWRLRN